jgi:catechol 2,3-dioxygenase-like lactoylglutathione lyase family enzyme
MQNEALSIRPFIGAKDFELSRSFYRDLGFRENILSPTLSVFEIEHLRFYLQNAFVKDWIDNTMVFLEVQDLDRYFKGLLSLDLTSRYIGVRLTPIHAEHWGRECFLHDPSGVLWHIGEFFQSK